MDKKLVYFADFGRRLRVMVSELIENSRGCQECCRCAGTPDEETCECINRKGRRDGTNEHVMSAGFLPLEDLCQAITTVTKQVIDDLNEKSFTCECEAVKKHGKSR